MRRLVTSRLSLLILATFLSSAAVYAGGDKTPTVRFTAWAIDIGNGMLTRTASLNVVVNRWATPGDVEKLSSAFNEGDMRSLLKTLEHMPRAGYFNANGNLGLDVRFAQASRSPDGTERIFLIAERRVGVFETMNDTPSADYPLSVIELELNNHGEGKGMLWPVARINYWDPKTNLAVIDNYTMQPVQLTSVRQG